LTPFHAGGLHNALETAWPSADQQIPARLSASVSWGSCHPNTRVVNGDAVGTSMLWTIMFVTQSR